MHPLVEEAMKKAAVVWIAAGGSAEAYPAWCVWIDGALYVVSGPGEQPAPGLAGAATAAVTGRGDHGGRIVTWPAAVTRVEPGGEEWEKVVPQLTAKRLNAPGTAEALAERWAATCVVSRLTPSGDPVEAGPTLPNGSLVAPVRPAPPVRAVKTPKNFHKVRKVA